MTQDIKVQCMVDRFWDTTLLAFNGTWVNGTLIDISTQSAEDKHEKIIPVGIVLLDDKSLISVPVEFIKKIVV